MPSELLINAGAGETRIAFVVDGVLQGYDAEPAFGGGEGVGGIYLGRVTRVMAAMQAAFVNIGQERDGFLSLRDAPDNLTEGAALAVRVTRAALGDKGAKLTANFALPPELAARAKMARPPALLAAGPDIVARALVAWKADTVLVDDARAAEARKIALAREDLFARHDLEEQVAALWQTRVTLPCTGWITLEATEGFTAVDVNSGSFAAAGGRGETARIVNREAAREIGRQLRLRRIGGLVVADFIGADDGDAVTAALRAELARDAAAGEVLPMNALGVVCIARQRLAAALARPEPGQEILRAVERAARAAPGREITVRAAPAVTAWLEQADVRAGLDRRGVGRVRYISEDRKPGDFDVAT